MNRIIIRLLIAGILSCIAPSVFAESVTAVEERPAVLGTTGYFCQVRLSPGSGSFGDHGYLSSILWSLPDCGGTYVGHRYFCSTGATSSVCPGSSSWHYNATQLLSLFEAIQRHVISGNRVIVQGSTGGYSCTHQSCGAAVDFYSN